MTDDAELAGLNPFDLLDREAARIDACLSSWPDDHPAWARPSRCAGWSTRDVIAHLAAGEEYHAACLEGTVSELLQRVAADGATDLHGFNAMGVAKFDGRQPSEILDIWRAANAANRRGFRERGDGNVDTSVGDYPCRWQAFHLASELATHADDMGIPVTDDERVARRAWRARFSRFALREAKPDLSIAVEGERTRVTADGVDVELDDDELVEAVAARLDETSGLDGAARATLSTMP